MNADRTRNLVTAGLLAALLAASAWFSIPIGSVPVTLQVFVVVLVALLLPPTWAAAAVFVYLLAGAVGLPVFAGARGGVGVLAGPTGGYLLGFVLGVGAGAAVRRALEARARPVVADVACSATVIFVVYAVGWLQLAAVTGTGLVEAALVGVVPFVAADAVKALVATSVASALRATGVLRPAPSGGS